MKLSITGEASLQFKNMRSGNEITPTMKSGEMIIGNTVTPFVLKKLNRGNIEKMSAEQPVNVSIVCFDQLRKTVFTEQRYVSLLLTFPNGQLWVYVKRDNLKDFFAAFCMAAI